MVKETVLDVHSYALRTPDKKPSEDIARIKNEIKFEYSKKK